MRDAVTVTPHPDAETQALVAYVVLAAQRTLPQLTVALTPNTRGKQWLVDRCCSRAWINDQLPTETMLAALRAAIAVLVEHAATPRPFIPAQRSRASERVA